MRRLLNIPNLLSFARILLTPFAAKALVREDYRGALVILAVAGLTDALDGILARRFGWITSAGSILDPIADKFMLVAVYVGLGISGLAPLWLVGIVLGRDVLILAGAGLAILFTTHRKFPPSGWGKISTIAQVAAAGILIAGPALQAPFLASAGRWLVWAVAASTVWSGLHYGWRSRLLFREPASDLPVD